MLVEAINAWRKTRHPRWAAIADFASVERPLVGAGRKNSDLEAWQALEKKADPEDFPRLFEALAQMPSGRAADLLIPLSAWSDPRAVTLMLAMLGAPPWQAGTSLPFFRAAARFLAETKDVRARDGMLELAGRYRQVIDRNMGDTVGLLLKRTADAMEVTEPGAVDEARLVELERKLPPRLAPKKLDERGMLEAIWAAPDEDAPRLVYADALMHRGDPRGELISLQIQRARGASTPETRRREYELLGDSKRFITWCAPLSQGGECLIERGFPYAVSVNHRTAKTVVGHAAWGTVRKVTLPFAGLAQKTATPLLAGLPSVREVHGVTEKVIDDVPTHVTGLGLTFLPTTLERFQALDSLELFPQAARQATALPGVAFERLKRLVLPYQVTLTNGQLAKATKLTELTLRTGDESTDLSVLPALDRLELGFNVEPARLSGLKITWLRCARLEAFDAVPSLRTLETNGPLTAEFLASMLDRFVASPLERLGIGGLFFVKEQGGLVLEVRHWDPRYSGLTLPHVHTIRLRPPRAVPEAPTSEFPSEERIRALQVPRSVKLEAAWH